MGTPPMGTARTRRGLVAGTVTGVLVLALLLALGPRAVSTPDEVTGDPEIAEVLRAHAPRGAGTLTAFVIDGEQTWFAGLGADEHAEHEIGSITKPMVAELLHQAVEEGELSRSTTVAEVLGQQGAPVTEVTLEELAEHTSGLPRSGPLGVRGWARNLLGRDPYAGATPESVVEDALDAELSGRGEDAYSNLGVALLGQLLARDAGTSFEGLMAERLFAPLGMTQTYVGVEGTVAEDAPRGRGSYGWRAEPWDSPGYAAAGAVRSTSADMALFARHVLGSDRDTLSWAEDSAAGLDVLWHNGGTGGFSTMLVLHRPTGTAAYVATDSVTGVEDLGLALFEHLHTGGER